MDNNIFSGDELVILIHKQHLLIGGTEQQQELLFCELSALIPLDPPTRLEQATQVSFGNMTLEYKAASHSISLSVPASFVEELCQRHDLSEDDSTTSLDKEELNDQEASEHIALEADQKELYKQTVGDLVWLATCCRPDLSFEAHLLAQSLTSPTTRHQKQLQRVLRHLAETRHSSLSLHPTTKTSREKPQSLELVAYSSTSWTEACKATSTAYLELWGASLIASCKTSCAQQQEHAELESMRLALGLACLVKSILQQLDMDQLEHDVHITLKTSSWKEKLVPGRPIAQQLGLSRRNKHQQLRGQLQISKVHPSKNLAHSLSHNASDKTMLAKLRINPEVAETGALSTVFGQWSAFLVSSSSLLVGMVAAKPSQMEKPQLRQLAFPKSVSFVRSCPESLSRNFADKRETSLTMQSLSLQRSSLESLTLESWSFPTPSLTLQSLIRPEDRFHSLTWQSLSLKKGNSQSLTLQSLSLKEESGFEPMSFKEVSFDEGTEELDKSLAHIKMKRRAETSSFSRISLEQRMLAQEAETNSFSTSLSKRILSFRMCLRIFLLCSFQLVCAALLLENGSFRISFSDRSLQTDQLVAAYSNSFKRSSLQPEELAAAYSNKSLEQHSFQQESLQQDELTASCFQSPTRATQLDSLQQLELCRSIFDACDQLDLEMSLSFPGLSRNQLQTDSFCRISLEQMELYSLDRFSHQLDLDTSLSLPQFSFHSCSSNSFEKRALHCAALPFRNRFSRNQLQSNSVQSFQLTGQQLCLGFVSGGASETRASTLPLQLTASTLISLSLAFEAWLKSSKTACSRRMLRQSLCLASLSTRASQTAYPTTSLPTTSCNKTASTTALRRTSSKRRTLLSVLWFSFLFNILLVENNELSETVLELELEKLLANQTCSLDLYHGHLEQNLWSVQLQQLSLEKNKQKKQQQLSATVPDRELSSTSSSPALSTRSSFSKQQTASRGIFVF